jgi:hypothetical protein
VNGKVNSKLKVFSVVLVAAAVVGALVYMPLTMAVQSDNGEAAEAECENMKGLKLIWWLLNNSEPVEIEGKAVTYHKEMLVVDTGEEQVRIALPEEWTVETDVVTREMLFGSGYLSQGENVTVKALRTNIFEKTAFSIYLLIGYEIIDDAGVHSYAAIPLNIEA